MWAVALYRCALCWCVPVFVGALLTCASALSEPSSHAYTIAEKEFQRLPLDQKYDLQVMLAAAGYWNSVSTDQFSKRLFEAILQFQNENRFAGTGYLSNAQYDQLRSLSYLALAYWKLGPVVHPQINKPLWIPKGLALIEGREKNGLVFTDSQNSISISYLFFPGADIRQAYQLLLERVSNSQIEYKILRTDFFVISNSQGVTHSYTRYHAIDGGILGFTVAWWPAENIYGERLATIMSDLFRANVSLALDRSPPQTPLNYPRPVTASRPDSATNQVPNQSSVEAPVTQSSGTGLYVSPKGHLLTSAHVIENCRQIMVSQSGLRPIPARVISSDKTNDLALLKSDTPAPVYAQFRSAVRLGEGIAVFGFPLTGLLATSGNFTIGNITALAGLQDDTRIVQMSAPVQPGNSGGPILDQSGNVVGIVLAKLNALKLAAITNDLAQNINFGIKSSVAISFIEANAISIQTTGPSAAIAPADLADKAKSFAVFVECQR